MKFQLLIKAKILKDKDFSCFKLSDVVFIMLINVKMPTVVMSMIIFMLHEKSFMTSGLVIKLFSMLNSSDYMKFQPLMKAKIQKDQEFFLLKTLRCCTNYPFNKF